jgi:FKBP12-rapamycin complex-associated protein
MKSATLWPRGSPAWKWIHGLRLFHRYAWATVALRLDGFLTGQYKIIARIQTPSINIRRNINSLLTDVGKHHPQALIYPLTVASKSSSAARKNAALKIMDAMREHSATIVEQVIDPRPRWSCADTQFPVQASIVSHELIRVAILWHELWHEGLEEASRLYFTERNPEGMVAVLEPLHDMIEAVCSFPFSHLDPDQMLL